MMSQQMSQAYENAEFDTLPFLSKSKLTSWVKCPRQFYYKQNKSGDEAYESVETDEMRQGTLVHETIETYYENIQAYAKSLRSTRDGAVEEFQPYALLERDVIEFLPQENLSEWESVLDPFITNFLAFEAARQRNSSSPDEWIPVGIEQEAWSQNILSDDDTPWMGFADIILPAASLPVNASHGVCLIDFKTGRVPHPDFRDTGIFLELEYYSLLFDDEYDITSIGAYYPLEDTFLHTTRSVERQEFIRQKGREIIDAQPATEETHPIEQQALCCWGPDDGERCPYYESCESNWASPLENKEEFISLCKSGKPVAQIAETLDTTEASVEYWAGKITP